MKKPKKVSFYNSASEASYIYFHKVLFEFSRQKSTLESTDLILAIFGAKLKIFQPKQTADIGKNCKQTGEIRKMNVNKQLIFVK